MPKIVRIEQTCHFCPSQWDAWDEYGVYYYIRYRWGFLSVDKGDVCGEQIFGQQIGDDLDGVMSTEEMFSLTGLNK